MTFLLYLALFFLIWIWIVLRMRRRGWGILMLCVGGTGGGILSWVLVMTIAILHALSIIASEPPGTFTSVSDNDEKRTRRHTDGDDLESAARAAEFLFDIF